jgi:hypothetical protein
MFMQVSRQIAGTGQHESAIETGYAEAVLYCSLQKRKYPCKYQPVSDLPVSFQNVNW